CATAVSVVLPGEQVKQPWHQLLSCATAVSAVLSGTQVNSRGPPAMRNRRLLLSLAVAVPLLLAGGSSVAPKNDKGKAKDGDAIFERARAFVAAFDKGDAKAVAAFWTKDGDYTDQTGKHLKGRAEIQKAFAGLFAENKGARLRLDSKALRFVTADVALEDG